MSNTDRNKEVNQRPPVLLDTDGTYDTDNNFIPDPKPSTSGSAKKILASERLKAFKFKISNYWQVVKAILIEEALNKLDPKRKATVLNFRLLITIIIGIIIAVALGIGIKSII